MSDDGLGAFSRMVRHDPQDAARRLLSSVGLQAVRALARAAEEEAGWTLVSDGRESRPDRLPDGRLIGVASRRTLEWARHDPAAPCAECGAPDGVGGDGLHVRCGPCALKALSAFGARS